MQNYHDAQGGFPIGRTGLGFSYKNTSIDNRRTWAFSILPQLEQSSIFNAINFNLSFYVAQQTTVLLTSVAGFHCPSDPQTNSIEVGNTANARYEGNYVVNWGNTTTDRTRALPMGPLSPTRSQPALTVRPSPWATSASRGHPSHPTSPAR